MSMRSKISFLLGIAFFTVACQTPGVDYKDDDFEVQHIEVDGKECIWVSSQDGAHQGYGGLSCDWD